MATVDAVTKLVTQLVAAGYKRLTAWKMLTDNEAERLVGILVGSCNFKLENAKKLVAEALAFLAKSAAKVADKVEKGVEEVEETAGQALDFVKDLFDGDNEEPVMPITDKVLNIVPLEPAEVEALASLAQSAAKVPDYAEAPEAWKTYAKGVQEDLGSIAKACEALDISRQTWYARFKKEG